MSATILAILLATVALSTARPNDDGSYNNLPVGSYYVTAPAATIPLRTVVSTRGRPGRQTVLLTSSSRDDDGTVIVQPNGVRTRPASLASATTINRPLPTTVQQLPNGDYYAEPVYTYAYSVNDDLTKDTKQAQETRNGNRVEGSYTVNMPDGSIVTTTYYADETGYHPTVTQTNADGQTIVLSSPEQYSTSANVRSGVTSSSSVRQQIVTRPVQQLTRIVETQQAPLVTVLRQQPVATRVQTVRLPSSVLPIRTGGALRIVSSSDGSGESREG